MSFWRTYYHLVWDTEQRAESITPEIEPHLYRHIVDQAYDMSVIVYAINGWSDHIHLVCSIPPTLAADDFVQQIKTSSVQFVRSHALQRVPFTWARGYGILTLGESQRVFAESYVSEQKMHHQKQTTNEWLERSGEQDEQGGGFVSDPLTTHLTRQIRDDGVLYNSTSDPFPF